MKDLREGVASLFAEHACEQVPVWERFALALEQKRRAANRKHQADWRARQTRARLSQIKREEYRRNRAKRLAWQKAYEKVKRKKRHAAIKSASSVLARTPHEGLASSIS
jgi:hypothetical protein